MVFDRYNRKRPRKIRPNYPSPRLPPAPLPADLTGSPYPAQMPMEQLPPAPMPPPERFGREPHVSTEKVQAVMETLMEEKLRGFEKRLEKLDKLKESIKKPITNLQGNINKLSHKVELLEKTLSERIEGYGKNFTEISVELRALHKVFQTILPTFTENIKELRSIVDRTRVRHMKKKSTRKTNRKRKKR